MHRNMRVLTTGLVFVCVWATAVLAQAPESFPIEPKHYGSIPYLSGGVGLDEREDLSRMTRDYNLKLSFAVTGGDYLGDVAVEVRDAGGRMVLEAVSEGPWFFAKLPPGRYTVVVRATGKSQQKTVQLSGRGQTVLNLFWK